MFDQITFLYSIISSSLDLYLLACISPSTSASILSSLSLHLILHLLVYRFPFTTFDTSSSLSSSLTQSLYLIPQPLNLHPTPLLYPVLLLLLILFSPSFLPLFNPPGTPSSNGDPELGTQDLLLWASAPVPMVVNMLCRIGSEKGIALSLLRSITPSPCIPISYFSLLSLPVTLYSILFLLHILFYFISLPPSLPPTNSPSHFSITQLADSEAHLFVGVVRYCARSLSVADPEVRQCVRAVTSPLPPFQFSSFSALIYHTNIICVYDSM